MTYTYSKLISQLSILETNVKALSELSDLMGATAQSDLIRTLANSQFDAMDQALQCARGLDPSIGKSRGPIVEFKPR